MKVSTTKEWAESRLPGEEGKEIGAGRPDPLPAISDSDRIDWLQSEIEASGYGITMNQGFSGDAARTRTIELRTQTGSGPWQRTHIKQTLRAAIDAAITSERRNRPPERPQSEPAGADENPEATSTPAPYSEFRHEVLERYPSGEKHEAIKRLARRWAKTGEWRFRQEISSAAGALIEDAQAVFEPEDEHDVWIVAECMVDLAESCREFLARFESSLGCQPDSCGD